MDRASDRIGWVGGGARKREAESGALPAFLGSLRGGTGITVSFLVPAALLLIFQIEVGLLGGALAVGVDFGYGLTLHAPLRNYRDYPPATLRFMKSAPDRVFGTRQCLLR